MTGRFVLSAFTCAALGAWNLAGGYYGPLSLVVGAVLVFFAGCASVIAYVEWCERCER